VILARTRVAYGHRAETIGCGRAIRSAAYGTGLDERRDENRTHQPTAGTKETGPGVVGNRWVAGEGAIGGADRQLKDWIQGGAG